MVGLCDVKLDRVTFGGPVTTWRPLFWWTDQDVINGNTDHDRVPLKTADHNI